MTWDAPLDRGRTPGRALPELRKSIPHKLGLIGHGADGKAEVLTRLSPDGVPNDIYEHARTQFSEQEISDLTFAVMAINAWNRVNIAFTPVPGSLDKEYGLDKANLA